MKIEFYNSNLVKNSNLAQALEHLKLKLEENNFAFFKPLQDDEQFLLISQKAEKLRKKFKTFVIIGTGGSSLGAQALCELTNNLFDNSLHQVFFLSNIDAKTFDQLVIQLNLSETYFISISKSGSTAETIFNTLCIAEILEKANLRLENHLAIITEKNKSPLYNLAQKYKLTYFEHDAQIGGRFSIFSIVGMLPAALAGINIQNIQQSALKYLNSLVNNTWKHDVVQSAYFITNAINNGNNIAVFMPYSDKLQFFSHWYAQLFAESLGKQGQGATPVIALGTVDQHSQLQLYKDGPQDKSFTFLLEQTKNKGPKIAEHFLQDDHLQYLKNRSMGDLLYLEGRATINSLLNTSSPVRVIEFNDINEELLGTLFVHFICEIILIGEIMKINAFNQPGVEHSKILAREYMLKGWYR